MLEKKIKKTSFLFFKIKIKIISSPPLYLEAG